MSGAAPAAGARARKDEPRGATRPTSAAACKGACLVHTGARAATHRPLHLQCVGRGRQRLLSQLDGGAVPASRCARTGCGDAPLWGRASAECSAVADCLALVTACCLVVHLLLCTCDHALRSSHLVQRYLRPRSSIPGHQRARSPTAPRVRQTPPRHAKRATRATTWRLTSRALWVRCGDAALRAPSAAPWRERPYWSPRESQGLRKAHPLTTCTLATLIPRLQCARHPTAPRASKARPRRAIPAPPVTTCRPTRRALRVR